MQSMKMGSILFWIFTDAVIEQPDLLEKQFEDIRNANFTGVMAFVRASRYGLEDPLVIQATKQAAKRCHENNMAFWFTMDPRLASRYNNMHFKKGLPMLICGDKVHPDNVPNTAPVENHRFNLRLQLYPRQTHMMQDVAYLLLPQGIERAYAFPANQPNYQSDQIRDITKQARFFFNARDNYVEAFGSFEPPDNQQWRVMAFFKFDTTFYDFSDADHFKIYNQLVQKYADAQIEFDGITWDEPGYYAVFGAYPFSKTIQAHLAQRGKNLTENLWKLVLPAADHSEISLRNDYFQFLQTTVLNQQAETMRNMRAKWQTNLISGIHYTWHFESADMADMNHGSMDIWRSLEAEDAGFTDLGGINQLRDPDSPWYANLAAMNVATQSMARYSERRTGFINLWTISHDDGTGYQNQIMNHCVNLMRLFSIGWLPHAYGPVGLLGDEDSFLGTDYLPGYPNHSTWRDFPKWNHRLQQTARLTSGTLRKTNLLVIFPVETLYAIGGPAANESARDVFKLILWLTDAQYAIDWLSPVMLKSLRFADGNFHLNQNTYDAVIFPHPRIIPPDLVPILKNAASKVAFGYEQPEFDTAANSLDFSGTACFQNTAELADWLQAHEIGKMVQAPETSWVSVIELPPKTIVSLCPSRVGQTYQGEVVWQKHRVNVPPSTELTQIIFSKSGKPEILQDSSRKETAENG